MFDLDGTLLPMDVDKFMYAYKESLENHFKALNAQEGLFNKVMTSVGHVVKDQGPQKNDAKFFDHFFEGFEGDKQAYLDHFEKFYEREFDKVQLSTYVSKPLVEAVGLLKAKGYKMIIATNPIFPMAANLKRIEWAGLDPKDFDYISSFESNTACKPFSKFYQEVLTLNDLKPDQVLMVGNDAQEDLAVKALGVKTYLINDHLINREQGLPPTDYYGSYEEFYTFVDQLLSIKGE